MTTSSGKVAPLIEFVAESGAACLVTMVQGNLFAVTVTHLLIASQTGIIAGGIAAMTLFVASRRSRWIVSITLALTTGVVDFFMHPGMFGSVATEAIVTGLAAGLLSCLVGSALRYPRGRAAASS